MAEARLPILRDGLTLPEKIMLASLTRHVGFPVLVKLIDAMCEEAVKNVIKLDPEKDIQNYEKLLSVRQLKSRTTHENARDLRDAVQYHIESAGKAATEDLDNQLQLGE
jgi:hypothetical protein